MSMIHEITARAPKYKAPKRKGRGEGSGQGKTAGRGTKGSGARQGKPLSKFHEGGQTRIYRRLPTRGFSNHDFRTEWYIVNVSDLNDFEDGATVDTNSLQAKGLVPDAKRQVKILGDGNLTRKLTVVAGWYSKSAHQKITTAGGTAQNPKGEVFVFPKPAPKWDKRKQAEASKGKGKKAEAAAAAPAEGEPAAPAEEKKPE